MPPTPVNDGHADIAEDVSGEPAAQQLRNTLPAMLHRVELLEVVLAAIPRQLQLRPCTGGPQGLAHHACFQGMLSNRRTPVR